MPTCLQQRLYVGLFHVFLEALIGWIYRACSVAVNQAHYVGTLRFEDVLLPFCYLLGCGVQCLAV